MHADDQTHADQLTADELRAEIAVLRAERDQLASALKLLEEKHDALLRQIYKKRSERYATDHDEPLFEGLDHPEPPAPKHVDGAPDAVGPRPKSRRRDPRRPDSAAPLGSQTTFGASTKTSSRATSRRRVRAAATSARSSATKRPRSSSISRPACSCA